MNRSSSGSVRFASLLSSSWYSNTKPFFAATLQGPLQVIQMKSLKNTGIKPLNKLLMSKIRLFSSSNGIIVPPSLLSETRLSILFHDQ